MEAFWWMEMLGIAAFAFSGAQVAVARRMDVFGVFVLGSMTAVGGGILRDGLILNVVPAALSQPWIWVNVTAVCLLVSLFRRPLPAMLWTFCDAVGLGAFTVGIGARLITAGHGIGVYLMGTLLTAVGGGMMRDLLAQRIPVVLRKDIYALACLAGALLLWGMMKAGNALVSMGVALCLVIGIRMVSAVYQLQVPVPGGRPAEDMDNTMPIAPIKPKQKK